MTKAKPRYFIDTDDDGNWYYVPFEKREEWNEWSEKMQHATDFDLFNLQVPGFAIEIDGPHMLTFTDPEPL